MAEHHRDKAEQDCGTAVLRFDKEVADRKRDKAFYEARILALSEKAVPTSQPDSEAPLSAAAIDKSVLMTRVENLKKELSIRDVELAKLRSEVSLSPEVNTLRAELAEAKAIAARLSGMYEQKSKDFRDSELEQLALLGKQILADGAAPAPPARPRPVSRRGRQRSRSSGRAEATATPPAPVTPDEPKPSSQPYWQDEPLFTKHVAAVTTATMSALPHLPFETAIATAFSTVRSVGPPPPLKLDKKPGNRRSAAPSPPTPAPAPVPHGNFTFADIARAAVTNVDDTKKKPTWRAMETSKALVLRPSTKGTRVSELHLKIPKTTDSAELFRLKGTALLERIAKVINDHSEPAPRMALRENPLVLVKWSMRGNLVLKCAKPMDDLIKNGIKDALEYFFPSPSAEIMVLNKPPTTALKFLAVPRHNLDGSDTDDMDLLNDLTAHPMWADVELWANPKFINLKQGMAGATVVVSVIDDNQGNVGRRLMGTMVNFSGCLRPCKRWVELPSQPFCSQCQSWGHPGARCPANVLICARCGGTHDFRQHDRYCDTCKKGPGHSCTPFCRNCRGPHMSMSKECPFYLGRTSKERHAELYAEIEAKFPKARNAQTGPTRKSGGTRKKVGFSNPDAEGFIHVGTPGIARIDTVSPEPAAPASVKPLEGSIIGALADEALRPELRGNEEHRILFSYHHLPIVDNSPICLLVMVVGLRGTLGPLQVLFLKLSLLFTALLLPVIGRSTLGSFRTPLLKETFRVFARSLCLRTLMLLTTSSATSLRRSKKTLLIIRSIPLLGCVLLPFHLALTLLILPLCRLAAWLLISIVRSKRMTSDSQPRPLRFHPILPLRAFRCSSLCSLLALWTNFGNSTANTWASFEAYSCVRPPC